MASADKHALEMQVAHLNEKLNTVTDTLLTLVEGHQGKPQSPGLLIPASPEKAASGSEGGSGELATPTAVPDKPRSTFDSDNSDSDDGEAMVLSSQPHDDGVPDAHRTPETRGARYGAFGEELREVDNDPKRKKAAGR